MAIITVTIPTVADNRYQTEIRPSIVTVRTSESEAALTKSSNVTLRSPERPRLVPIESRQKNLYQHAEHYFRIMNAANGGHQHRSTRPDAPADVETEMAEEEGSEMAGPVRASPSDRQPYSA